MLHSNVCQPMTKWYSPMWYPLYRNEYFQYFSYIFRSLDFGRRKKFIRLSTIQSLELVSRTKSLKPINILIHWINYLSILVYMKMEKVTMWVAYQSSSNFMIICPVLKNIISIIFDNCVLLKWIFRFEFQFLHMAHMGLLMAIIWLW